MKLLFMTGSLVHGGAERHAVTLANRLAERGHECHFAYVKDDSSQRGRLRGAASVTCLDATRYLDFAALRALVELTVSIKPTHIIAANEYAMLYAWLAMRRARFSLPAPARLAVTFHSTAFHTLKRRLQMMYYRPLFRSADCLVFVCEGQRRYWRERRLYGRRTDVIHNGIDLEHWTPVSEEARGCMRRTLDFAPQDLVVGISAVLRPEKNHVQLVEAIAALRRRGLPARALLIGDGPMRAAVEARARSLGIAEHVLITGFQQDVRLLVGACDTVVLCSTVETFSIAALEAMALARPVVHAELGGAAEMIAPGHNGFLFPVGDTPALVERLAALAEPQLRSRMGAAARETVAARFAEHAMVERYEQTLLELETTRSRRENLRRPAGAH